MTTEWQLFEITQRGRNFPVSGNGVERGTAVRARCSRKALSFLICSSLGQPPAEWIGGVHHPPSAVVYIRCRSFRQRYWLLRGQPPADAAYRYLSPLHAFHSALCTLHSPLSTLHSPLCTLHSALSTLHSPLSTLHSPLSTLHTVLCPSSFVLCPLSSPLSPLSSPLDLHNWKKIATFARFFILYNIQLDVFRC